MKRSVIHVEISEGEDGYFIGTCPSLFVVTQGKTLDELTYNLREAIEFALEGQNMSDLGYVENPSVLASIELALAHA